MTLRAAAAALVACVACMGALPSCSRGADARVRSGAVATRVVSLAPSMTEAMFAIGAGSALVGRSRFCDFPPEARAVPVVGGLEPDFEAVLALRPDLVVGVSGLSSARLSAKLEAQHIAAWFPEAKSLAAIDEMLLGLGARLGHAEEARRVVDSIDTRERAIAGEYASAPARPRVLFVVSLGPVVAAGPGSFADELIRSAGGENVVTAGAAWPTLGLETIATLDPDVILDASDVTGTGSTRITGSSVFGGLRCVREGRVHTVHDERLLRPGPRIADALAALAGVLHPKSSAASNPVPR